jgi:segregation and condensation protein A
MKAMNIDMAGEFLVMAATLMHIKSKLLLPVHEDVEEDTEDPRLVLTRPLIEYIQMKSVAEELAARTLLGEHTFVRKSDRRPYLAGTEDEVIQVGLFELIDAFKNILDNLAPEQRFDLSAERMSVNDRIAQLVDILEEKGTVAFDELFHEPATKNDIIVTFLAVLEMVKVRLIRVLQHVQSGAIRLIYL